MEKDHTLDGLPPYHAIEHHHGSPRARRVRRRIFRFLVLSFVAFGLYTFLRSHGTRESHSLSVEKLRADYATCAKLRHTPQDPSGHREKNARFVEGKKPILIRNATVWTGEPTSQITAEEARVGKGYSWIKADVLLKNGLIARVAADIPDKDLPEGYEVIDAQGRQVTAGIIDMHSHAGVDGLPELQGAEDTNELSSDITPYVRSLDGLNPLDHQIQVIKSGGVTTSLILPGSGNNMGGEAFVIKHAVGQADGRPELSIEDMLADPERNWRYMKMACGENAKNVYGRVGRDFGPFSRLGEAWYFRHAFGEATKYKNSQDDWCASADEVGVENMDSYLPQEIKWETLSAALRGQVMVNTHCYTIPDLESFVGYTNEFNFSVRAFHHAHGTYLIPEVLKRAYGGRPPAAALFADNMYYKAESYVASEQAGKILYEAGITPVYVSDNPVLNAQHVVFEAAKAYKNGLPYHAALAGVTSASAELLGLGERIGKVKEGFDADLVLWDADPLSVGATPLQVIIDGVPQFEHPTNLSKPLTPPLEAYEYHQLQENPTSDLVLTGVTQIQLPGFTESLGSGSTVVIRNSSITCIGHCEVEVAASDRIVALENGYIAPAATAFGSLLGLEEITAEDDTQDGPNSDNSFSKAIDGLTFEGKNLEAAFAHGVTKAITAPKFGYSDHKGISVGFRIGAKHALEKDAILAPNVALHYTLTLAAKGEKTPSISSAIAELKTKLMKAVTATSNPFAGDDDRTLEFQALKKVVREYMPLVIGVHSADTTASLLRLKAEVEAASKTKLKLVILGGAESYMLADELAAAHVGVVLTPLFSYAQTWDQRRALTGAPLTNGTAIDVLHGAGVKVAIGVNEDWETRDLFLQAGIVHANSGGKISESDALSFITSNVYALMGLEQEKSTAHSDFVVFEGNPLTIQSQVRAVADGRGHLSIWS